LELEQDLFQTFGLVLGFDKFNSRKKKPTRIGGGRGGGGWFDSTFGFQFQP